MFKRKVNIYCLILTLAAFATTIIFYKSLPDLIPIHWNIYGEVDNYAKKSIGAFMPPFLMLLIWPAMIYLPKLDPKKENYKTFQASYDIIIGFLVSFFFGLHVITLLSSLGYRIAINKFLFIMLGLLFMVIGNYLPKAKSNYFYGVRTPWTLSSEISWKRTHRLAGKLFVASGLLIILSTFIVSAKVQSLVILLTIAVSSVIPIVASYLYAKK